MSDESLVFPVAEERQRRAGEAYAELLNTLLEAERAGAKLLAAYVSELPLDAGGSDWLSAVQRDEAHNCSVLIHLLLEAGVEPGMAVGAFYEKGMAIRDWRARLEFLNRGQAWVARRIAAALPCIADELGRKALQAMHQSHLDNIALCKEKLG